MRDRDTVLNENIAPAPRGDLSDRILSAANAASPANDLPSRRPWWAVGGVAAMAVMAALFVLPMSTGSDVAAEPEWDQLAQTSGFGELYDWVEGEDG